MRASKLSPSSRQLLQAERRRLQRAADANEAHRLDAARNQLSHAEWAMKNRDRVANSEALLSGIGSLVRAVKASWGIDIPLNLQTVHWKDQIEAFTDFKTVSITYPAKMVPTERGKFDTDVLRKFLWDIKGLAYHEIGHLRFTVPFPSLLKACSREHLTTLSFDYRMIWNALEDQRMEAAVVAESPDIAQYFTTTVLNHLLNYESTAQDNRLQWLLVHGRRYLPAAVRAESRGRFVDGDHNPGFGEQAAVTAERIIDAYMAAVTADEMVEQVILMKEFVDSLGVRPPVNGSGHSNPSTANGQPQDTEERITRSSTVNEKDEQSSDGTGSEGEDGEESDGEESDGEDKQAAGKGEENSDDEVASGQQTEADIVAKQTHSSKGMSDLLNSTLKSLEGEIQKDASITDAIREINEKAASGSGSLARYQHTTAQPDEWKQIAESTVNGMVDALRVYTADSSPIWQQRQTRGVIDPFTYRTRSGGSLEYRRLYDDHGDCGIDISVTVLLDVSGSMIGSGTALGAAAYACKKACDTLEIPCVISLFDNQGWILWNKDDVPEHLAIEMGGSTNPTDVLSVIDDYRFDKKNHIVVVMTDGVFDTSFKGFSQYSDNGRYFLGLGYGAQYVCEALNQSHPHEAHRITDLMEIPTILANFLATFLH